VEIFPVQGWSRQSPEPCAKNVIVKSIDLLARPSGQVGATQVKVLGCIHSWREARLRVA